MNRRFLILLIIGTFILSSIAIAAPFRFVVVANTQDSELNAQGKEGPIFEDALSKIISDMKPELVINAGDMTARQESGADAFDATSKKLSGAAIKYHAVVGNADMQTQALKQKVEFKIKSVDHKNNRFVFLFNPEWGFFDDEQFNQLQTFVNDALSKGFEHVFIIGHSNILAKSVPFKDGECGEETEEGLDPENLNDVQKKLFKLLDNPKIFYISGEQHVAAETIANNIHEVSAGTTGNVEKECVFGEEAPQEHSLTAVDVNGPQVNVYSLSKVSGYKKTFSGVNLPTSPTVTPPGLLSPTGGCPPGFIPNTAATVPTSPSTQGSATSSTCSATEPLELKLNFPTAGGSVWVPAQARCGGNFDLIVLMHGHKRNPGTGEFIGSGAKIRIENRVKALIDSGKSAPVILADPVGVLGTGNNWPPGKLKMEEYVAKVQELVRQHVSGATISRVSAVGHSNANCGGGGRNAFVESARDYPLYVIGPADGTCRSTNYGRNMINAVGSKNTIVFLMTNGNRDGDKKSLETVASKSGVDDLANAANKDRYVKAQKNPGKNWFAYQTKGVGHYTVVSHLVEEMLQRFFTSPPGAGGVAPGAGGTAPSGCVPAGVQTGIPPLPQTIYDFIIQSVSGQTKIAGVARQHLAVGIDRDVGFDKIKAGAVQCQPIDSNAIGFDANLFKSIYGETQADIESQIESIAFMEKTIRIHRRVKQAFACVESAINECEEGRNYKFNIIRSYDPTQNPNPEVPSLTNFGIAAIINENENKPSKENVLQTDIPICVREAFKKFGFKWGGEFENVKVPAYFAFHGDPSKIVVTSAQPSAGLSAGETNTCKYCSEAKSYLAQLNPDVFASTCRGKSGKCCTAPCPQGSVVIGEVPMISQCVSADMGPGGGCWRDGKAPDVSPTTSQSAKSYCSSACGVASIRMALERYGINVPSEELYCGGPNTVYRPGGSSPVLIEKVAKIKGRELAKHVRGSNWDDMVKNIREGKPIILGIRDKFPVASGKVKKERCYTSAGHYVILVGASDEFGIINDPGGNCGSMNPPEHLVVSRKFVEEVTGKYVII